MKARKVPRAQQVQPVHKVPQAHRERRGPKGLRVRSVHRVLKEHRD